MDPQGPPSQFMFALDIFADKLEMNPACNLRAPALVFRFNEFSPVVLTPQSAAGFTVAFGCGKRLTWCSSAQELNERIRKAPLMVDVVQHVAGGRHVLAATAALDVSRLAPLVRPALQPLQTPPPWSSAFLTHARHPHPSAGGDPAPHRVHALSCRRSPSTVLSAVIWRQWAV